MGRDSGRNASGGGWEWGRGQQSPSLSQGHSLDRRPQDLRNPNGPTSVQSGTGPAGGSVGLPGHRMRFVSGVRGMSPGGSWENSLWWRLNTGSN